MSVGRIHMILYSIFFFSLLFIPTLASYFLPTSKKTCEKRTLTPYPIIEFHDSILKKMGQYYEDHYGLRNEFMQWQSYIKKRIFLSSANPKDVQIGKNNWLFPTSKIDFSYGSYTHLNLLTPFELKMFKITHVSRKKLLEKRNCDYILAVWPNKTTIYPEYVPKYLQWMVKDTISKVDQIIKYFEKTKTEIQIIYPKNYLLQHKKKTIYFKNDTHWNYLGAFYGYTYFLNHSYNIFKVRPNSMSAYKFRFNTIFTGDLLELMGLCTTIDFPDKNPQFQINNNIKIYTNQGDVSYKHLNPSAKCNKKVLFFRDSYTKYLIPFLVQHYKESYYYWQDYDQKIVDSIKPDVVVVSKVERYF